MGTSRNRLVLLTHYYYNYSYFISLTGEVKSHIQYFKHCRNKWVEHFVMETNKTVVRLEKLLCNLPQDPNKRKSILSYCNFCNIYDKYYLFVIG